jgi:hypothetical protein
MITGWLRNRRQPRPDHGSGYYVRSTAHPVVPAAPMTHAAAVQALNSLDAVYATTDQPAGE